jgi:hypothetical protein
MLAYHGGPDGALFRRLYAALEAECGPFTSDLLRIEASRAAADFVHMAASSRSRSDARRKAETGKGRRPSPGRMSALGKRHGLDEQAWVLALDKLRELTAGTRTPSTPAELLASMARDRDG